MTAKSKIISASVLLFFFVFLVLATDLVHGSSATDHLADGQAYTICMMSCSALPSASLQWACEQACAYLKIESTDEHERVAVESPKLVTGLFNHGVAILEASPNSLIAQGRLDAHAFFFVAQGKATADLILQEEDKREAMDLKVGDIISIPSGTQVFMINKDTEEKLVVIKLPQPASQSEIKLLNPFRESSSEIKLLNPFRGESTYQHQAEEEEEEEEEGIRSSVN